MKLNDKILVVLNNNDFYPQEVTEQNGEYYVEINCGTPAGEDWWETIWFDGTSESFIEAVKERYLNFDVDEEVEVWIGSRGENGVPSSIRALVEDAEWKEKKLETLSDALGELDIDELEEDEEE